MKRTSPRTVAKFLSFSRTRDIELSAIEKFTVREWNRVESWLADAGLAFYFLQKLKDMNSTGAIPASVLSRLERNFASNQARIDNMASRFHAINRDFESAGLRYLVVKGFSLAPEFCPCRELRHQADLDYLVAEDSLPIAAQLLIDAGYSTGASLSSKEFTFISSGVRPSRSDTQYSPHAQHAVELHTDIWDGGMHGLPSMPRLICMDRRTMHDWNGSSFPGLTDEDAFLLQVLHACRHLFTQWIRMSCLFEIGYFLNRRWADTELWCRVEERVQNNAVLRDFVVIVSELAAGLFAAPLPALIHDWGVRLPGPQRVWINHYAEEWSFCELPAYELRLFPRSKLVLFLQQQYRISSPNPAGKLKERSSPSRLSRIASSLKRTPALFLNADWRRGKLLGRRSIYYALAQARYLCEIPRWRWRTRSIASDSRTGYF